MIRFARFVFGLYLHAELCSRRLGIHRCTHRFHYHHMLDSHVERRSWVSGPRRWHARFHLPDDRIFPGLLYRNRIYCLGHGIQLDRPVGSQLGRSQSEYRPLCLVPALAAHLYRCFLYLGGHSGHSGFGRDPANVYVTLFELVSDYLTFTVYLTSAGLLFAIGQIFNYVISVHLCSATDGKINGALFETFFTLLSVIMIWTFWSSITEDDWPLPVTPGNGYN